MNAEQKLQAIQALAPAKLEMVSFGNFRIKQHDVEIKFGDFLKGCGGTGATVELAIENHWNTLTNLPSDQYIVVNAYQGRRQAIRWNGFMWSSIRE